MLKAGLKTFFIFLIKGYRYLVSPLMGRSCRFHPTCSAYALEAVERHGPFKGLWFAFKRILKCHPFCKASYHDPVPGSLDKPARRN